MKREAIVTGLIAVLLLATEWAASAGAAEELHILKISAQDERAVIKTPDGKMEMIKVGDSVGNRGRVIEITKDRIVIEEEMDTVIIRLEDGKQILERIGRVPPGRPMPLGAK